MASSSDRVRNWWGTLNEMNKAEAYFGRTLDAKIRISTRRGRVRLLSRDSPSVKIYHTPDQLPHSLGSDHMIILEDLSREWVEALGPRFGIPVSVFALHWTNPIDHVDGEVRVPIGESPARHFILNYRQSLPFSIEDRRNDVTVGNVKNDLEYRLDCNVVRPITSRSKTYRGHETSEQLVTYYATGSTGNGASSKEHYILCPLALDCAHQVLIVLLVDPMIAMPETAVREVALSDDGENEYFRGHAKCNDRQLPAIPPLSRLDEAVRVSDQVEAGSKVEPNDMEPTSSLFEELFLPDVGYINTHPLSLTHRIRRLVLARNVAAISSLLQETIQLTGSASIGVSNILDFNFDTFEKRAWVDEWRGNFFRQLWVLREDLEFQGYKLQQNLRVVNKINTLVDKCGKPVLSNVSLNSLPDPQSTTSDKSDLVRLAIEQEREDLSEWNDLEKLRLYAFKIMERTTDSYLQTVQATGAQFANMQSKSVGRVTGLLGLFVPGSLCAAVLAIPNFGGSTENQKFWIFWAVSVPLAVILMVFFLTSWPKKVQDRWKDYQKRREGDPVPAYLRRPLPV